MMRFAWIVHQSNYLKKCLLKKYFTYGQYEKYIPKPRIGSVKKVRPSPSQIAGVIISFSIFGHAVGHIYWIFFYKKIKIIDFFIKLKISWNCKTKNTCKEFWTFCNSLFLVSEWTSFMMRYITQCIISCISINFWNIKKKLLCINKLFKITKKTQVTNFTSRNNHRFSMALFSNDPILWMPYSCFESCIFGRTLTQVFHFFV